MHSIVIYLILLFKIYYLISHPRKPIQIYRNECMFEIKMHTIGIDLILLARTRLFNLKAII